MDRRLGLAAAVLLLGQLVGGCGSDDAPDPADATATEAATSPADSDYQPLTEQTLPRALVDAVLEAETGRLTTQVMGTTVDVAIRVAKSGEVALAGSTTGSRAGEFVLVDGEAFLREAGDRKWSRLPADLVDTFQAHLADLTPSRIAEGMRDGIESLEYIGDEDRDGTTLHGYTATIDQAFLEEQVEHATSVLGVPDNPMIDTENLPETAFDLWVDDDALVHRLELKVAGLTFTVEMSGWGEPVEIEAPTASQVSPKPLRFAG